MTTRPAFEALQLDLLEPRSDAYRIRAALNGETRA